MMSWRDLLQSDDERLIAPWLGGRSLRDFSRTFKIEGKLPAEQGWQEFKVIGRNVIWLNEAEAPEGVLRYTVKGYLLGDRIVPDGVRISGEVSELARGFERVHLIEPGLDRFVRISAGRFYEDGPLIYENQEFPLGPEDEVQIAYFDEKPTVNHVVGVAPALDAAFRVETWRRAEAERIRKEEEERRAREERQRRIRESLGTGDGRRQVAAEDFGQAARAALAVGGARYLDHVDSHSRNEKIVRFMVDHRRYECVCDALTLRIIDSGICLTNEGYRDVHGVAPGASGNTLFTLESLPSVIREADRAGALVVFRHVR